MRNIKIFLFALFLTVFSNLFGQDSTRYEIHDVIYLNDGRILKGEILAYDSQLGGISFKDLFNRVYNFSRQDYKYFLENQSFLVKTKKKKVHRERKNRGIGYTLGLNTNYLYGLEKLDNDNLNSRRDTRGYALGISGTIGTYFTRSHFLGANAEIGVLTSQPRFYNFGVRYNYEYDRQKTNTAMYIPVELKYQNMILENSGIPYTEITPNSIINSYYFPKTEFSSILFSIGHGFGFILKNGGAFDIELSYQRHLTLSQRFYDLKSEDAIGYNPKFQVNGFRLGFSLSF